MKSCSYIAHKFFAGIILSATLISVAGGFARGQAAPGVTFTTLHSFGTSSSDGVYPGGTLVQGPDGDLYGETGGDDVSIAGTIFKIDSTGVVTTLFTSKTIVGGPYGGLALGSDGNFYGISGDAGSSTNGILFQMTPAGAMKTIYSFTTADGGAPETFGAVAIGPDGNFYGSTVGSYAPAVLFKVTPSGQFTTLYTYDLDTGALSSPIFDQAGNLYVTNPKGDGNNAVDVGTVIKVDPSGAASIIYTFISDYYLSPNGGYPDASLTLGLDGNLYGLAETGGANDDGTAFVLTPQGQLTTLYSFPANTSVYYRPEVGLLYNLIQGTDGNFYGVTQFGGVNANGTVFQLTPSGAFTLLYTFSAQDSSGNNADGAVPSGPLVEGSDGALYGSTDNGGMNGGIGTGGYGTFFKLTVPSLTASITVPAAAARFDFNKDGHADLLWYNTTSGSVSRWLMDDQAALQYGGAFSQVAAASGWMPVATPQTTADGYPDLLWWNSLSGEMSIWNLQDQSVTQYGADFSQIANTNWKPEAVADNNAKGAWTLVFEDAKSGDICRWLMNGSTVMQYGGTIASLGAKTPWQIVGAPDLDGDGKSDLLLWNSKTGEVAYWSMDLANSKVLAEHADIAQVTDTSWHLVGSEDTNGDGHPDLIWWNASTGVESRWLLDGTTVEQYGGGDTQITDTTWQPTAIR